MRRTVLLSDITGNEITEHAVVRLTLNGKMWTVDADQSDELVTTIQVHGREQRKRGRKPKVAA